LHNTSSKGLIQANLQEIPKGQLMNMAILKDFQVCLKLNKAIHFSFYNYIFGSWEELGVYETGM
jgi:hypothetical protein